MMELARDDLAALRIRVKPLVWEDQPGGSYCWTQGLHYYTEGSDAEQDWYVSCMIYDDDVWQGDNQSTREAAKAVAQADYEARILAALEVTPRALLDARAELDRVAAINVKHCEAVNTLLVDGARLEDRAKAAEAERDRLRADAQAANGVWQANLRLQAELAASEAARKLAEERLREAKLAFENVDAQVEDEGEFTERSWEQLRATLKEIDNG